MTQLSPAQLAATAGVGDLDGVATAILAAYLIQLAKNSKGVPFVTPETARIFSAIIATLSAAGISLTYQADSGMLLVTGLTVSGIAKFGWLALKQFAFQDLAFRVGFKLPDGVRSLSSGGSSPTPPPPAGS